MTLSKTSAAPDTCAALSGGMPCWGQAPAGTRGLSQPPAGSGHITSAPACTLHRPRPTRSRQGRRTAAPSASSCKEPRPRTRLCTPCSGLTCVDKHGSDTWLGQPGSRVSHCPECPAPRSPYERTLHLEQKGPPLGTGAECGKPYAKKGSLSNQLRLLGGKNWGWEGSFFRISRSFEEYN